METAFDQIINPTSPPARSRHRAEPSRRRGRRRGRPARAVVVAGAALVGAVVGTTGMTAALWTQQAAPFTGSIQVGLEHFAVGAPAGLVDAAAGHHDPVTFTLTEAMTAELLDTGTVAIPIHVAARSEGNKGLRYDLEVPAFPAGTVWWVAQNGDGTPENGDGDLAVFQVPAAADCSPSASGTGALSSEPVPADPAASATVDEYWCVVASVNRAPQVGTLSTMATGAAQDSRDRPAGASASAQIPVLQDLDATGETHDITFRWETFRP